MEYKDYRTIRVYSGVNPRKEYYNEYDELDNLNGPAVAYSNGEKIWYVCGKVHRDGGPAKQLRDRDEWYWKGKIHRDEGPAIEYKSGTKFWYSANYLHRIGGPAVEYANGSKEWFYYGFRHREDGPAIITAEGNKFWYNQNVLHRVDGPAVELIAGRKEWYIDGKRHRIDGPAVECLKEKDNRYFIYGNLICPPTFEKEIIDGDMIRVEKYRRNISNEELEDLARRFKEDKDIFKDIKKKDVVLVYEKAMLVKEVEE